MADRITPGEAFVAGDVEVRVRARLRRVFTEGGLDMAEVQLGVGSPNGPASYPGAFPVVKVALKEVLLPGRGEATIVI